MSPTAFEGLPASTVIEPRERRAWQAGEVVCAQGQQGVTVFDGLGGDP
jgi:hypothetical protein